MVSLRSGPETMPADRPASIAFHLAIPVSDLANARWFYGELLGCPEGRSSDRWIDYNFFGHQLVCHCTDSAIALARNDVDGDAVPVPHFGAVLDLPAWRRLADRLQTAGYPFALEPRLRFEGETGEQGTFFIYDPFGNAIEFKGFADADQLFATSD